MVQIIQYQNQHQKEIKELIEEISKEFNEPISTTDSSSKNKIIDEFWIATKNDLLIGTIGVIRLKDKNAILKSMFVKKSYRGKGIGVSSLLLETAMKWAKKENIKKVFLGTMTQFKAAQKFYKKNGFAIIDRTQLPLDFIHNPIDDIYYKIDLAMNNFHYRVGNKSDLKQIMELAMQSWKDYKATLTTENWTELNKLLTSSSVFLDLLNKSYTLLCETSNKQIVGMAFLVPSGNPTEIYQEDWSYIRFVSVNPAFGGQGIGRTLTEKCIEYAKNNKERIVALHTSEMMGNAISIYEKVGFKILRELKPRLGKKYWLYKLEI